MTIVGLGVRLPAAGARAPLATRAGAPLPRYAVVAPSGLASLRPHWAALADRAVGDNAFFHPDFALAAMAHLGRDVAVAAVAAGDGRLLAAVPFTRARLGRVAPAVRVWSHKYGPLGTPLVDAADPVAAAAALIDGLAPAGSGVAVVIPDLPLDGPVAAALVAAAQRQERPVDILGPRLRAILDRPPGGGVDLRATLPARRRKELGRQFRRLADLGTVTVESATDPRQILPALDEFMTLEAAGWKGRGGTALISSPESAAFVRAAVADRAASGAARIDWIAVGGRPVAMLVSFMSGATAFTWKVAYDETFARFSPGAQLMLEAAARIFAETAVERIDSCADANHPMIDRLWAGRMTVGTMVIGPPDGSLMHRAGLVLANAEAVARAGLKRLRR